MLLRSALAEGPALLGTCRPKHRRGSGLAGRLLGLGGDDSAVPQVTLLSVKTWRSLATVALATGTFTFGGGPWHH